MAFNMKKIMEKVNASENKLGNIYLDNTEKGRELVIKIIANKPNYSFRDYKIIDRLIDKEILDDCSELKLKNEYELYLKLKGLSDRLANRLKLQILKNKVVIGVGGQFSAGKSAFLNAVIGKNNVNNLELPTSISPTTAVPTYIVNGSELSIKLSNINGGEVTLDNDALNAITHAFKEKYGLGLAQYISFISVSIPGLYENVALLDTPGYSKSDVNTKEKFTDSNKAKTQLRLADYLIWLVDAQNGTLKDEDISFIKSLKLKSKILILVSKCDLKNEDSIKNVIQQINIDVNNNDIDVYDIVPFSILRNSDYYKKGMKSLEKFFYDACRINESVEDIQEQLNSIIHQIKKIIEDEKRDTRIERDKIGDIIFKTNNIMKMLLYVKAYSEYNKKLNFLHWKNRDLENVEREIFGRINSFI